MVSLLVELELPDFGDPEVRGLAPSLTLAGVLLDVAAGTASTTVVRTVGLVLLSLSGGFAGLKLKLNLAERISCVGFLSSASLSRPSRKRGL